MPLTYLIALFCIQALWLSWALFWIISAFRTKRTVYRQPWRQRLIFLALPVAALLFARHLPTHVVWIVPPNPLLESLGVALCTLGMAFTFWARILLGRNWSGFVTLKENHQLIQSGPYRVVRHPIYTGLLVAICGSLAAIFPAYQGLFFLALITIAFIIKLRQEEKLMLRQFPQAYPAYKSRVPHALIPFVL